MSTSLNRLHYYAGEMVSLKQKENNLHLKPFSQIKRHLTFNLKILGPRVGITYPPAILQLSNSHLNLQFVGFDFKI